VRKTPRITNGEASAFAEAYAILGKPVGGSLLATFHPLEKERARELEHLQDRGFNLAEKEMIAAATERLGKIKRVRRRKRNR